MDVPSTSPFLPAEVLIPIFKECERLQEAEPRPFPLAIVHVCRRWRQVALSLPLLWRDSRILSNTERRTLAAIEWWASIKHRPRDLARSSTSNTSLQPLHFCAQHSRNTLTTIAVQADTWEDVRTCIKVATQSAQTLKQLTIFIRQPVVPEPADEEVSQLISQLLAGSTVLRHIRLRIPAAQLRVRPSREGSEIDISFRIPANQAERSTASSWVAMHRIERPLSGYALLENASLRTLEIRALHLGREKNIQDCHTLLLRSLLTLDTLLAPKAVLDRCVRMSADALYHPSLRTLVVLGTSQETSPYLNRGLLPAVINVEGLFSHVKDLMDKQTLAATLWLTNEDIDVSARKVRALLAKLQRLTELTVIAKISTVQALIPLFAPQTPPGVPLSEPLAARFLCPQLRKLVFVVLRHPEFCEIRQLSRQNFESELQSDWTSHKVVQDAVELLVRKRTSAYAVSGVVSAQCDEGNQSRRSGPVTSSASHHKPHRLTNTSCQPLQRVCIRSSYLSIESLWAHRAACSNLDMLPRESSPISEIDCVVDIVPEAGDHFDLARWDEAQTDLLRACRSKA